MQFKTIHGSDCPADDVEVIIDLLSTRDVGDINYDTDNWENKPNTLLYALLKTGRFNRPNGGLVVGNHDGRCVCVSGYSRSHFNSDIYILGSRTYIHPHYRHQLVMSSAMIPYQINQISGVGKMGIFLFDRKNRFNLYDIVVSGRLNLFLKNKYSNFSPLWDNLRALSHPISIWPGVVQNVLYIKLDPQFDFDWTTLKASNV